MNKDHIILKMAQTIAELQDKVADLQMQLDAAEPECQPHAGSVLQLIRSRVANTKYVGDPVSTELELSDFIHKP